jgi:hypothetical protein
VILIFWVEPGASRLAKAATRFALLFVPGSRDLGLGAPQLGDPQVKAGLRDHHCLTPCWHCLSQGLHPRHRQRDDSLSLRARHAKPRHAAGRQEPILDGRCEDGPQSATRSRSVPGERIWDRSLTQACTCEGCTAASRMEPISVPSMCLLIREATRVAVVGRWGPVPAHWRAYSPTVTGFASLMYRPDNLLPRRPLGAAPPQVCG